MESLNPRKAVLVALLAACAAFGTGCYADAEVEPVPAYGYQPQIYEGAVVYYDAAGQPFTYVNGGPVYVPVTSPYYGVYASHWRMYGHAYHRWYAGYGHRYHGWRRRWR
jgi:hypothetical protein